ncbi:MAG TPA: GH3 auxin-responsive promoter family protein [Planctomycetota bacterium]|nr:GH3 auxin-responsive promoter family protein [Planctomycetota bacterium]
MLKAILGNLLWTAGNLRHHRRFLRARRDRRAAQETILLSFLQRNAGSAYGRAHGYASIRGVEEFQDRVPIVTYEDLEPWVERAARGEQEVLTMEPVLLFEKTSGSSGAEKLIPYTASLLREFRRAVGAWMFDLFTSRPALLTGSQYWSLTPLARGEERTSGGIRIGFEDDCDYFGPVDRAFLRCAMAAPRSFARLESTEDCLQKTAERLVSTRDLRFISVWSPSFLPLLLRWLPAGSRPADLWPNLRVISCWTGGAAARFVPELRDIFPGVEIQGKGLLATEGVVSIPLGKVSPGSVSSGTAATPAFTSHFLEFLGEDGRPHLADQLDVGRRYSVVMTTGGGFARYDLGDEVEVVAPDSIEFVGRRGGSSDICGEKLSEAFVESVLGAATRTYRLSGLAMLAPEWGAPPRYVLFVESRRAGLVARFVEERLRESYHYDYSRRLGQLEAVEGVEVSNGDAKYLRGCEDLGQRLGAVKPACLRREPGWRQRMETHALR